MPPYLGDACELQIELSAVRNFSSENWSGNYISARCILSMCPLYLPCLRLKVQEPDVPWSFDMYQSPHGFYEVRVVQRALHMHGSTSDSFREQP